MVVGFEYSELEDILKDHGRINTVGKSFAVIKFTKSRVSSEIRYFNYASKDSTKAIEWGVVSVNGSRYLVISTSKRSTDAMILNFE